MLLKLHFKTLFFWHSIFLSAKHVNFLHIQTAAFAPLSWVFYANSELFRIFAFFGFCVASNTNNKKSHDGQCPSRRVTGRGDGTWTHGLCVPNAALYQTEPRFVNASAIILIKSQFVNRFFQIFLIFSNIFFWWSYTLLNLVLRRKDFGWISAFYRICIWLWKRKERQQLRIY